MAITMKTNFTNVLTLAAIAITSVSLLPSPSEAQRGQGFYCDFSGVSPATMYQNSQGGIEKWISWDSDFFSDAGWTPAVRCNEVSKRLESFRKSKLLKYVTVGIMNGERVICTASEKNGRCSGLIYTLKPSQDAVITLYNFFGLREGQAGVPVLSESGEIPYIDVSKRLGNDASANTPKVQTPAVKTPSVNPKTSPGVRKGDFE
ncbi:MAG: COP23 domain-containing protein [Pseudanabaena sp.]|jgi:hypothetical protein